LLLAASLAWVVFGAWLLFRSDPGVSGFDPLVGHVVVFFFVSVAAFGLAIRPLGAVRGFLVSGVSVLALSAISEALQPILTATRQAQPRDFGANSLGIAAAFVLSALLVGVFRKGARREFVTAMICVVGLLGSATTIVVGGDRINEVFTCWGKGLEPISAVAGAPIIHVEGESARVGGGEALPLGDGIVADDSAELRCSVLRSGDYSVVATVAPDSTDVGGPMRIFTSSSSTDFRRQNTHLGQDFDQLSIRISTEDGLQWESVPGVFVAGRLVTVAMVVSGGQVNVFVDGDWRAVFDLAGDSFVDWDESFPILIGDEFTRDRTFEGLIETVSVFDRAILEGDPLLGAGQS